MNIASSYKERMFKINNLKDTFKIGQFETLFGGNLRKVVLGFIITECIIYLFLECITGVLYISSLRHFETNKLVNETYELANKLEIVSKLHYIYRIMKL